MRFISFLSQDNAPPCLHVNPAASAVSEAAATVLTRSHPARCIQPVKGLRCSFGVALASFASRRFFVAALRNRGPDAEDTTMFRVTCIELDDGEFAVCINHHYL